MYFKAKNTLRMNCCHNIKHALRWVFDIMVWDPTSAGEGCVAGLISSAGSNMLNAF